MPIYLDVYTMGNIINYLNGFNYKIILKMRLINKQFLEYSKSYTASEQEKIEINQNFKKWKEIFPKLAYIKLNSRSKITNEDFLLFDEMKVINMALCTQKEITDGGFANCHNLLKLNLQGACGHWFGGNHFTDELFKSLTKLEELYMDDNHVITDEGISLLCEMKDLHLSNCSKITNNGFKNFNKLVKLIIYNLNKLDDGVFNFIPNLEYLSVTFNENITDKGILQLKNIRNLILIGCNTECYDYDKLLKLKELSLTYISIPPLNFNYLRNINRITFYGCSEINGFEFQYLTNTKEILIYECRSLINIDYFEHFNKVYIFRCRTITKEMSMALKLKLGEKFITD